MNTSAEDAKPSISADGSTLYFMSTRPGGRGSFDLWQVRVLEQPRLELRRDPPTGELHLECVGQKGASYVIERSAGLSNWEASVTITITNGSGAFLIQPSSAVAGQFYRGKTDPVLTLKPVR